MSPHQYAAAFRRFWYVVVVATLLGGAGGLGLSQIAAPVYTATASLYFSLSIGGNGNDLNQGATYTQNQMQSFAQLAGSPFVLSPVIDELGLDETPKQLGDAISVSTPQNTVVMQLSVADPSPTKAEVIANAVASSLTQNVEKIAPRGTDGKSTVTVRVIQPAVQPTAPSSPNTRLNLAAGLLLGLIVGILGVVLKEVLETRVHSAALATSLTGAPLLGTIDKMRRKATGALVMMRDPLSNAAESYRQLRSNLEFVAIESTTLSVVVTSSVPSEGKSMIATNLALALSEGEQKVLLIDADLRRPSVAAYTGLEGSAGLTTILVGRSKLEGVVQIWGESELHVLTSGVLPPNPSELLSSKAMSTLVKEATEEYDVVIIDSPPLTAVADAAILTRLVDGALVIVDRTKVHRSQLAQTMDSLAKSGARALGLVLNRAAPSKDREAYYHQTEQSNAKRDLPGLVKQVLARLKASRPKEVAESVAERSE